MKKGGFLIAAVVGAILLAATACGGGEEPTATPRPTVAPTPTFTPSPTATIALEPTAPPSSTDSLAQKGRQIYLNVPDNVKPQALWCQQCHKIEGVPEAIGIIGPDQTHLGTVAATRKASMSAEDYIRESITDPDAFLVEGYSAGLMTKAITEDLTKDQVDALVAFLLTLQ